MKRVTTGYDSLIGPWVCERTGGQWLEGMGTTIALVDFHGSTCTILAGVLYDQFNGASIHMHVAAVSGRRWMTREFLWFAFHYPFNQLGVRKIIGLVPAYKEDVLAFDKHLGFCEEARIKDAHLLSDVVILTMTREQCRFLEIRNGRKKLGAGAT